MVGIKIKRNHFFSWVVILGLHVGLLQSMGDGGAAAAAAAPAEVPGLRYSWGVAMHRLVRPSYVAFSQFEDNPDKAFFAFYSKEHAGDYAMHVLHKKFSTAIHNGFDIKMSFEAAFEETDLEIRKNQELRGAWTNAACAYIDGSQLHLAWVGDGCLKVISDRGSRVVFSKNLDHTLKNDAERERIRGFGFEFVQKDGIYHISDATIDYYLRGYPTRFFGDEVVSFPDNRVKGMLHEALIATPNIHSMGIAVGDLVILAKPAVCYWLGDAGIASIVSGVLRGDDDGRIIENFKETIPVEGDRALFSRSMERGLKIRADDAVEHGDHDLARAARLLRDISLVRSRGQERMQRELSAYSRISSEFDAMIIRFDGGGAAARPEVGAAARPAPVREGAEEGDYCTQMIDRLIEFREMLASSGYARSSAKVTEIITGFSQGGCKSALVRQVTEGLSLIPRIMLEEKGTTTLEVSVVVGAVTAFMDMNQQFLPQ